MASGSVNAALKLFYKDYESGEVTVPAKGRVELNFGSTTISGYDYVDWCYWTGSNVDMRNRVILYGKPTSEGKGVKAYGTDNTSATGTMTVRIFYLPTGVLKAIT